MTSSPFIWAAFDFYPDRGVKFQSLYAGGRFRIAEENTDLHPDLIDEDDYRFWTSVW